MTRLWVLQTNERTFLDDCLDFEVYGVRTPEYMSLQQLQKGDAVLLRLRSTKAGQAPSYIGPYTATSEKRPWAKDIEATLGIWQKVHRWTAHGPRWLARFPWCVFLSPTAEFIHDFQTISVSDPVRACEPIGSPASDKILHSLGGGNVPIKPRLVESRTGGYRTTRGVWVRSRAEHMIDNWFTEHGIMTHYERAIYLDDRRIIPDWFIPSLRVYVEYLGLKGDPAYDQIWTLKEQAYKKHKIEHVTLDDGDLVDLDRNIPAKLPQLRATGILK